MIKSNNVLFKQTISMLECVHNASDHINRCIANKTTGVIDTADMHSAWVLRE